MDWNAYHFTGPALRDGRPLPAIGETLVHDGPAEMCMAGLHASRKAWQALDFAPGPLLHRVRCEDILAEDDEKLVCRRRTIVASIDATALLWAYARACARDVLHRWDAPDVVRQCLVTGDERLRTKAWGAASGAAWCAQGAGECAAESAAWSAAWSAFQGAAWSAAWRAALSAAESAAWSAAWCAQGAGESAAESAAWSAAWSAARQRQRALFTRMVNAAFKVD